MNKQQTTTSKQSVANAEALLQRFTRERDELTERKAALADKRRNVASITLLRSDSGSLAILMPPPTTPGRFHLAAHEPNYLSQKNKISSGARDSVGSSVMYRRLGIGREGGIDGRSAQQV